jgi:hypothetical protein
MIQSFPGVGPISAIATPCLMFDTRLAYEVVEGWTTVGNVELNTLILYRRLEHV